ncbi:MAG: choice-of-anchor L domain-containing protein [Bacteroidota bacterium]
MNRYLFLLFFQLSLYSSLAQSNEGSTSIQTELNNNAANLINDVFIKGTCRNISNIESSGALESIGVFENGADVINFSDGIILSTGNISSAEGPNTLVETTTQFNRPSTDRDLMAIATDDLYDVAVIEFDFVPVVSQVTFQYVFASEEYCEFVGTIFNDVFGFFVSGPGINGPFADGAINVARVPDSEEFVSINTINYLANEDLYIKNELSGDVANCDIEFDPQQVNNIEYDGFTVPLLARFTVIPCETYHIRLVVGDVGDDKLDSAVFLKSKSFNLGELATVKAVVPNQNDTVAYENCIDGQFVFTRPVGDFNLRPLTLDFEIDALSTALEGIDFPSIPRTVTIPAGQDSVVLTVPTFSDEQAENLESLTVNLNFSVSCECRGVSSATLRIADSKPPVVQFSTVAVCASEPFSLVPKITDGVPPFSFTWSDNSSNNNLQATILNPTNFVLTVTDFCNKKTSDTAFVNLQEMPRAILSGSIDYCEGLEELTLPINFNGHPPWSFTYQIDNNLPLKIDSIFDNNFNLPISGVGTYQLIEFRDAACIGTASGVGQVNDINIELDLEIIFPSCPDANDGQVKLNNITGSPPYDISWLPTANNPTNPTNLSTGVYHLMIQDAQNCILMDSIIMDHPTTILPACRNNAAYVPNVFSPNGDGVNDFFEIFFAEPTTVQQVLKVEIIDRWGNLVYFSEGERPKWDGQIGEKTASSAVFLYKIQLELNDGQIELLQGSLSLIR